MPKKLIIMLIFSLILAACGQQVDLAGQAIENYMQALVDSDLNAAIANSCSAWEDQALLEVDSLITVEASLEEMDCSEIGKEGEDTLVSCQGKIIFDYGDEVQEISLENRVFRVVQEDGDYRMCGYQ